MSKVLTEEVILLRTKVSNLEQIKNLNLWGNEIENVTILKEMPNIEILSLSVNKISTLKPFSYCKKLTELYLRKNLIQDLSEIRYLQGLPNLKVLWLWENPCAEIPNYREAVLSALPNLVKLDNQAVTPEEKAQASKIDLGRIKNKENKVSKENVQRRERIPSPVIKEPPRVNKVKNEPSSENRSNNVLCALLALIKELDDYSLDIVRKEIDRKLAIR
ncbi:hypothetical protein SteCoe_37911 [Stentor coeruleus]|uniref:U2A'/phosphoprotein 32 family A C-terminal domain-containing protein n=1 Tax=Stentor coeruleus TaxID=5963 RepID=A0A1R2AM53_9CILI|nr:hypothetical protein SteCoe_37911 [Stentor coeruleus]